MFQISLFTMNNIMQSDEKAIWLAAIIRLCLCFVVIPPVSLRLLVSLSVPIDTADKQLSTEQPRSSD